MHHLTAAPVAAPALPVAAAAAPAVEPAQTCGVPGGPVRRFGRERQPLRRSIWVCFRDRDGQALSPVVASRVWVLLLDVAGDGRQESTCALTAWWPSQREAQACVAAAGARWPVALLQ